MPARWESELRRLRDAPAPLDVLRERAQRPPQLESSPRSPRERWLAGVVAFVVFAVAGAFVWEGFMSSGTPGPGGGEQPPAVSGSVTLWFSAEQVPPRPVDVVALLVAHEEVDATFGVEASVERWDGHDWVEYGELVMCMDHWHCTARIQSPGEIDGVPAIGLSARPGTPGPIERFTTEGLDVGWYRISQMANEGLVASGIIEVTPRETSPAPLWSVDAPAISIAPALLPLMGGEVSLYPLVPPGPDGSLSREDMQRAVEGLSETASIERWDGSGWEGIGTVDLLRVHGDDLPRTAELPSLAEGAYRLVRTGPDVRQVGHFWVVGFP